MASNKGITAIAALFLVLNIAFFSLVSATYPNNYPYDPNAKCPIDALKLGVCANLLGGLLGLTIGTPPKEPCCSLLRGLVDLEAAVCLCTALRANVLGLHLNVPLSLTLLLNNCGCKIPKGFICP